MHSYLNFGNEAVRSHSLSLVANPSLVSIAGAAKNSWEERPGKADMGSLEAGSRRNQRNSENRMKVFQTAKIFPGALLFTLLEHILGRAKERERDRAPHM